MAGSLSEVQISSSQEIFRLFEIDVELESNRELPTESIVFQDKAGGFFYKHNQRFSRTTRNRHISWKVSQNCVHLTEISQDLHLYGNHLKIRLKDSNILPQVCIHESPSSIFIILATGNSVHRLCFNHPIKERQGTYISSSIEASAPSIFNGNPTGASSDPWCFAALPKKCHAFDSSQAESGECLINLITNEGSLLLVVLPAFTNQAACQIHELKQTSIMKRLWTGLVPTAFRGENLPYDSVQSATIQAAGDHTYIFALCKDLKIRIWSCQLLECIEEQDLVAFLPDIMDGQTGLAQSYVIRAARDDVSDCQYIAVFLNFRFQSQFIVFEVIEDDGDIELSLLSSHFSKMTTLLDFALTSRHIWVMWSSGAGESIVQYAPIEEKDGREAIWHATNLRPNGSPEVFVHPSREPRNVFMENLFLPGRFSKNVLVKTMQMTLKSFESDVDLRISCNSTMEELRESLDKLMLFEMQSYALDYEVGQEEYYNLQLQCWGKFYASAVQYDQVDRKPLGLFANDSTGLVGLIRQNYRGYLYPNNWLENLYLLDIESQGPKVKYIQEKVDIQDAELASEIITLVECIKSLSTQVSTDILNGIENSLKENEDIMEIIDTLANALLTDSNEDADFIGDASSRSDCLRKIELRLQNMENLLAGLAHIIDALDPRKWLPNDFERQDGDLGAFSVNASHSFSSKEGRSVLVETIFNRASINMDICRDLLLFINVVIATNTSARLNADIIVPLKAEFAPRVHELLRSYFTTIWLGRKTVINDSSDSVEASLKKFAALELVEIGPNANKSRRGGSENVSMLSSFVCDAGVPWSLNIFESLPRGDGEDADLGRMWNFDMKIITDMIIRVLWPSRNGTKLPEFLLSQGQFTLLIQYLHICNEWCTSNRGSREFIQGQAYLQNGEPRKALEHFFKTTQFIGNGEEFLDRLIPDDVDEKPDMIVAFLIKVMRLFEQFELPEMMILIATSAVVVAKKTNTKDVAMLWSNIFKCHMQLGHNKEAYQAIALNPDKQRRRNCLHNFIVTLCERGRFQEICEFSYSSMEDEVISIIETRARTVDITVNDYYDLLYAFHILRSDHRRAATAMYEYACRLCTEMHGLASLQQQAKCYLATINSLHICDQKYAWIVRPSEKPTVTRLQNIIDPPNRSPKRAEDGNEIEINIVNRKKTTKKTVIVELADLEKEYLLILAALNLVQFDKSSTSTHVGPSLSAAETIPLLTQAGLFDRAFGIAVAFKLDLEPIFEGLAGKCVKIGNDLSQGTMSEETWNWLGANDLGTAQTIKDVSAVEQAWRLLQGYLDRFSKTNGYIYYKPVSRKLLSLGCTLPTWLVNSYKEKNCAELIQLFIKFDLLEDAANLAIEYICAVLGLGKEYFGLKTALHATMPIVWLPYTAIDQLIQLLKDNYNNSRLQKVHDKLQLDLERYFDTLKTVSNDKIALASRNIKSG